MSKGQPPPRTYQNPVSYGVNMGKNIGKMYQTGETTQTTSPAGLTATDQRTQITLDWTDAASETSYLIQVSIDNGAFDVGTSKAAGTITYVYTPVTVGSTYTFKITAIGMNPSLFKPAFAGPVLHTYHQGTPGFNSGESNDPNVKLQFMLEESASPLIDTVSSIQAAQLAAFPLSNPTYQVSFSGVYAGLGFGATTEDLIQGGWKKSTATAALNIGVADHVVVEWWDASSNNTANMYTWSYNRNTAIDYGILAFHPSATRFHLQIIDDAAALVIDNDWTLPNWYDGVPRKFRVVIDRTAVTGMIRLYMGNLATGINTEMTGATSSVPMAASTLTNTGIGISHQMNDGVLSLRGTKSEWRISIGNNVLTNNSTP